MLPKFEENLSGLEPGKKFEFLLKSNEAYGDYEEEAVIDVPKEVFMEDGKLREDLLQLGNTIPMEDTEGNQLNGVVAEIGDEKVKMDFNSPMAGRDLHFAGEVLDIRQATKEELEHGHVHGPEGHHH
jgi:FKBP-type peptidyl-prolyl cis-trans isomerase SlyD